MPPGQPLQPDWTLGDAARTYNLANWGEGYFDISAQGHLCVRHRGGAGGVDLYDLIGELRGLGLELPVLLRFRHILRDRLDRLCQAFDTARERYGYAASYTAVYPIKVNQQRSVVEAFLNHGGGRLGLEAGSKPELMAVMALMEQRDGLIICNGYKDREYIRLALMGRLLGLRTHIVIEQASELDLVMQEAFALGIRPLLGMRVRLASIGKGKWQNTGGERAKFGLSAAQALDVATRLQAEEATDCMRLLHFHMGSQIPDIADIETGMREAGRYYAELRGAGLDLRIIDAGGGLGVDYEGSGARHYCSMNYRLEQYADSLVRVIAEICEQEALPLPALITETGRALTAHHAVLVTNVIDVETSGADEPQLTAPEAADPPAVAELWRLYGEEIREIEQAYDRAEALLAQVHARYVEGLCTLAARARAERIHTAICQRCRQQLVAASALAETLHERLAAKVFCNFSVFQSVPDVWAFNQIFPVVPLHRLAERPTERAILHDLTCDSDGQLRAYVDGAGIEATLPVHAPVPATPYILGLFLVGAYQEILGDKHNLFGDTHAVDVELDEQGNHILGEPEQGEHVGELLQYVHFDPERLRQAYQRKLSDANLSDEWYRRCLEQIESGLACYSYHEN